VASSRAQATSRRRPSSAKAYANLAPDIQQLAQDCGVSTQGAGKIPFICFDLAGGANLNGSEALIGGPGGQLDFLSSAGYANLGLPGDMVPNAPNSASPTHNWINTQLGLAWHSDGAILRGISVARQSGARLANTNGAVIPALSENDTVNNPHNPMYGIYMAGANGSLLPLIGSEPTVSGGNSVAPADMINLTVTPTLVNQASDVTGLVNTGQLGTLVYESGDAVAVLESIARISGGTDPRLRRQAWPGQHAHARHGHQDRAALRLREVGRSRRSLRQSRNAEPQSRPNIVGSSGIFSRPNTRAIRLSGDRAIMKMVVNGFAGAGTIEMGGFDYHGQGRATGETRNFQAGICIGACLEYAAQGRHAAHDLHLQRRLAERERGDRHHTRRPRQVHVGERQSDHRPTIMLVYNPKGRPTLLNGATSQQIGFYDSNGSVDTTGSPAANSVEQLVETVILNYMALHGDAGPVFGRCSPIRAWATRGAGCHYGLRADRERHDRLSAHARAARGRVAPCACRATPTLLRF
jgi:hypothetical protein